MSKALGHSVSLLHTQHPSPQLPFNTPDSYIILGYLGTSELYARKQSKENMLLSSKNQFYNLQ